MMQTVQLSIADGAYASAIRDAISHSCAWHVESVDRPNLMLPGALVLDEPAFARLPLPLSNPERVVLITRKDPQLLRQAWEAGIVSVVSQDDPLNTVLLAIMAAALRVAKYHEPGRPGGGISPTSAVPSAPISAQTGDSRSRSVKYK